MNNSTIQNRARIMFAFCFITMAAVSFGQELSKDETESKSLALFRNNKYEQAVQGFSDLYTMYPKEPRYNYYLGCCYLHLNQHIEKSVSLLRFAASKNFNSDVYYFLALASYRNYLFDEAEIALTNFRNLGSRKDIRKLMPENLAASIVLAREETNMALDIKVLTTENLAYPQIESVYALQTNGKFMPKAKVFMLKDDVRQNYQGYMYIPTTSENGSKLYITAYGSDETMGKDLYEIRQLTGMDYSLPVALSSVNSKYNEEYPYFDSKTSTLYFSSDRKGGLGGYDIYKSEYDPKTQAFKEPQRMEFPVNTPFDDFLYVPDEQNQTAVFISNRNCSNQQLTAYKIEIRDSPSYVFPKSHNEIREIAQLKVNVDLIAPPVVLQNLSPAKNPVVIPEYEIVIRQALDKQLFCDSLQAVIISKKNHLVIETDTDKRRVLLSSISKDQKMLDSNQSEADQLFRKANTMRNAEQIARETAEENSGSIALSGTDIEQIQIESPNEQEPVVTQLKLFAYQTQVQMPDSYNQTAEKSKPANEEALKNEFSILEKSPYSETNPIPGAAIMPDGLIYRIQLGAFSNTLSLDAFGGLTPLAAEKIDQRNITKYYVGIFRTSKDARKALDEVKAKGFADAFIVPYFNQEKITIQTAREIEFGGKN